MRRALVLAITLVGAHAVAHVAPSVDDNNRYLKLTPLGDRVRLAYTVFFGEIPGAQLRRQIDTDRDGTIIDPEGQAFGRTLAAEVAGGLDINVDGQQQAIKWAEISVGMGSSQVVAGSFSVDLVAYFCLASPRGRHQLRLFDRVKLQRPGETELKVEAGRGIAIDAARIGRLDEPTHDFRFAGPGGPLAEAGLSLVFVAGDLAIVTPDATCRTTAARRSLPVGLIVGAVALATVLAAVGLVLVRRRRRTG